MLESLNYSFRNPKNIILVIYRIKQLRNYKKNHGVLRGPQLGKQRWRPWLGILRVKWTRPERQNLFSAHMPSHFKRSLFPRPSALVFVTINLSHLKLYNLLYQTLSWLVPWKAQWSRPCFLQLQNVTSSGNTLGLSLTHLHIRSALRDKLLTIISTRAGQLQPTGGPHIS